MHESIFFGVSIVSMRWRRGNDCLLSFHCTELSRCRLERCLMRTPCFVMLTVGKVRIDTDAVPETTCDFYPNNPNNPSKMAIIRPKTAESRG